MRAGAKSRQETATYLISHPVRVQILTIANERTISPARYVEEQMGIKPTEPGEDWRRALSAIAYHFKALREAGCLEIVDEIQKRGSIEHIHRATQRARFDYEQWAEVSQEERHGITTVTWQGLMARTEAARLAGTLDARDDRWVSWTGAKLDERGWSELTAAIAAASVVLEQIREDAEARLQEREEEGISATFALMGFEGPAMSSSFYEDVPSFTRANGELAQSTRPPD